MRVTGTNLICLLLGLVVGAWGMHSRLSQHIETQERLIWQRNFDVEQLEADNYRQRLELEFWDRYVRPDSTLIHRRVSEYRSPAEADSLTRWFIAYGMQTGQNPYMLLSVAHVESKYNPWARSRVGALGVMQVMPTIWWGRWESQCGYWRRGDARTNICYGAHILRYYYDRCEGDIRCALAHYNAGPRNYRYRAGQRYADDVLREYEGGLVR